MLNLLLRLTLLFAACSLLLACQGTADSNPEPGSVYNPDKTNVYVYRNYDYHDTCYIWIAATYDGGGGISCVSDD